MDNREQNKIKQTTRERGREGGRDEADNAGGEARGMRPPGTER